MPDTRPAPGLIGNNRINLNTATMMQIVQFWLDRAMLPAVEVVHVKYDASNGGNMFTVEVKPREGDPDGA